MRDGREVPGGRREKEVNRLCHDGAFRHLDMSAVVEKGSVQGDDRVVLELRVAGEMLLEGFGLRSEHLGEWSDANAFRERPQVRKARRVPTVHENELTGLQDPERERLEVLGDHPAGPAEDGGLERDAEQGREVREFPLLVFLGGKAEGFKAPDRLLPDGAQPFGPTQLPLRGRKASVRGPPSGTPRSSSSRLRRSPRSGRAS